MADAGNSKAREVKVVLLGDTGVGKSSLVLRFVTNNFRPYSESTIGASFMSKMIVVNDTPIKYQIWDTAGQEKVQNSLTCQRPNSLTFTQHESLTQMHPFSIMMLAVSQLGAHVLPRSCRRHRRVRYH